MMKYLLIAIAIFTANTFAATLPPMNMTGYKIFCEDRWTKKGVVDQSMVDYCVNNNKEGYLEAQLLIKKYENQPWIQGAIDMAINKWTKKETRQDDMVAYTLKQITDGFDELEIASKKTGYDKNKRDACYRKWGIDFNMVWFCYKESMAFTANVEKPAASNNEEMQSKTQQLKLNPLETALDFEIGTKEYWTEFKEEGGLDKFHNWYGIEIGGVTLQRGNDGLVSGIILTVNPYSSVTIKQIRTTLNAYCGTANSDWKNDDMGMEDKYLAQASSEKCKSVWFDNYVAGRKIWSISISKKKY